MIVTAAAITSALTTAMGLAAATTATVAAGWIGATIIYGGMAISMINAKKASKYGSSSATYSGQIQTQTDQNLPIPLIYGTVKVAGNRIWQDENYQTTIKRLVAVADGEICAFSDIRLNDIPIKDISGISVREYYGTDNQIVDSIVGGDSQSARAEKVGSLKNLAYLAISVPRTQKIDMNYNLTTIVKGRKIRVYSNTTDYEIKYSENPAWVLFDFLTCYNGLGLCIDNDGFVNDQMVDEIFDVQSFVEAAAYCDEELQYIDIDGTAKFAPRFTFNMIFDAQTSARTILDEIYRSCRGGLFMKNGKLQFKIDKAEPVSKVFFEKDIIKGSETFETIPKEEHYDILKCTYVSPAHEWQKVEATAEIPEYRDGVPVEHNIDILSCTNFHQASRLAWYYVNSKRLQPYLGSFQTDYKGYDLEVGDVIAINSLLLGLKDYKVKVTSVNDNGAGVFTINWRTYDERLYSDELGSKEPYALVSNLTDIMKYPDDVQNFNVVQVNNLFKFAWLQGQSLYDTYEIRMGETWEQSAVLAKGLVGNSYTMEIPTTGLFKFWIKAHNSYNYSKTPIFDVINVNSVPNLNEIVKIDVLDDIQGVIDGNLKVYHNTLKLYEPDVIWHSLEDTWNNQEYYQTVGVWGTKTYNSGSYTSQVYDIGKVLESVVSFDTRFVSADDQNKVVIEWTFSSDGKRFSDWCLVNSGTYTFRYCKFRVFLKAYNNVQLVLTNFVVAIDVPDKYLDLELKITEPEGLEVEYDFVKTPSIVATVNDNLDAYVVVAEKTNKKALLKAYTNDGVLTTCALSLHAKGY